MKKKIAIFTWCYTAGAINFGQILQCYSLQKHCKEIGFDVVVVKYRKLNDEEDIRQIPPKGKDRDRYESDYKDMHYENQESGQARLVNKFIDEHIEFTQQCYCEEDILEEINGCDVLLVGSDQLWNPLWIDCTYLLDFDNLQRKRISYATSGICSEKQAYKEHIKKIAGKIENFEYVSVRESISKRILKKYTNKKIGTLYVLNLCIQNPIFLHFLLEK